MTNEAIASCKKMWRVANTNFTIHMYIYIWNLLVIYIIMFYNYASLISYTYRIHMTNTVAFILSSNIIYGRSVKKSYFLHFGYIDWYISHGRRMFPSPSRVNLLRDIIATLKVSNVY